jgi:uncharacterized SAM-binding protein YcdF (DUF218 family)
MTYVAGRIVWLLLRPSNLLLLMALVGVLGMGRRRRPWAARLVTASVLLMTLVTLLPVGLWLTIPLEARFPRPAEIPRQVDGIVVLGGGVQGWLTRARGVPSFDATMERFASIPDLARRYPDARILFTGGTAWDNRGSGWTEARVIRQFLADQGLPPDRVTFEDRAQSTRENAVFSLQLAGPQPGQRWLLVTSAKHMPRAMGVFRAAGWPELEPWPVDYRTKGTFGLEGETVLSSRLYELDEAAYEWYGLLYYRLLGYTRSILPGPAR